MQFVQECILSPELLTRLSEAIKKAQTSIIRKVLFRTQQCPMC